MMYYLYDDIQTIIQELEKHNLTVVFKEDEITVYGMDDFLVIEIKKIDNSIRTFSIPLKSVCYELLINKSIKDNLYKLVSKIVSEKCLEYSSNEILTILNDMKITKDYSEKNKGILKNVAIIWRDHFLEENIGLLSGFVTLGVKPNDILALDKGDSTEHRFEITATFKKMGFNVDILDNSSLEDDKLMEVYRAFRDMRIISNSVPKEDQNTVDYMIDVNNATINLLDALKDYKNNDNKNLEKKAQDVIKDSRSYYDDDGER